MRSGKPGLRHNLSGTGIEDDRGIASRQLLAAVLFAIGVLVGMVLIGASVYADFESSLFNVFLSSASSPHWIKCPILLSSGEDGVVITRLKNREDVPIRRFLHVNISRGHLTLMRGDEQFLELAPGEMLAMEWEVTGKDAVYGHLIFAKVLFSKEDQTPLQLGSCGILVLDLPWGLKGQTVIYTLGIISFICITAAITLWWRFGRSYTGIRLEATRAMLVLGLVVILGLIFALAGLWRAAAVAFYLAILAIGVVVPHFMINLWRGRKGP
ncbi:MAG: hypothetical protein JW757_09535 [Anaerolineales bacterium]|nr:hypothetical protein [Anaerolineales bacterium]